MRRKIVCIGFLTLLLGGVSALAQEAGAIGINFSAGSEIGVGATFHVNDTLVLRPQVYYDHLEMQSCYYDLISGYRCFNESAESYGVALSTLFNAFTRDSLTGYGGFDLFYDRLDYSYISDGWRAGIQGLFGLRYRVAAKVALYGEAGLRWTRQKNQYSEDYVDSYGTTTAAVGVTFYLK
jgi:hypothetical protein